MNIVCDKKLLTDAVAGVSKAVTPTSAVPVLQGILLKADGFSLTLTGYDLEMAITTSIEANVKVAGEIVLPAKLLFDMIKSLDGEEVSIDSEENMSTTVKSGITEYDLMGMSATDFPELPNPGADRAFEIDAAELASMISTTIYAVSTDDKKPAQTGELFSISPGYLKIVAIDGFRFALSQHPVITDKEIDVVVPAKTANEVAKLMGDAGQTITVDANDRYIVFSNTKYTLISRLIEDSFLNYKDVIPEGSKTNVNVDVAKFERAIERCSVIITERLKNPLRVTFDEDIQIRCQTVIGKVSDKIEADIQGDPVEIGFNYRYLLDALRYSGCDEVKLELSGHLSPVKIMPTEGDDFLFLVLPVRFKND